MNKKAVFITGTTGFLGSYLLKILLKNGHKVYALSRPKKNKSGSQRVIDNLKFWGDGEVEKSFAKLIVLEGDITKPWLGLDDKTREIISREVKEIYHCAALTNLNSALEPIREINVMGTRNVLGLAHEINRKSASLKVNHISTAFIYGDHSGSFKETDLDLGQKFNTTYEQTKFEAEKLVGEYRKTGLWIDVYRPPIIVGHSQSGKAFRFRNIYQLLHICSLRIFDTLPISNPYINIVPVDWAAETIYLLSQDASDKNKNYHPFPEKQASVEEIIRTACKLMEIRGPRIVDLKVFDISALSAVKRMILERNIISLKFKAKLESKMTSETLKKIGYNFPEINKQILANTLKFYIQKEILSGGRIYAKRI